MDTNICSYFFRSAYKNDNTRLFLRVLGSKSESTRSGRTLRGRGSCWERGNHPLWPRRLHSASNRTSERAGATARITKRKITVNCLTWLMVYILLNVKLNSNVKFEGLQCIGVIVPGLLIIVSHSFIDLSVIDLSTELTRRLYYLIWIKPVNFNKLLPPRLTQVVTGRISWARGDFQTSYWSSKKGNSSSLEAVFRTCFGTL